MYTSYVSSSSCLGVNLLLAVSAWAANLRPESSPPEAPRPRYRVPRSILAPPSFRVRPAQELKAV